MPEVEGDKPKRKFKAYPIGYFHIDIAEVRSGEGKIHPFVAIDRTSKFAFVELHQKAGKMAAAQFLRNLIAALPYRTHAVLTGRRGCATGPSDRWRRRAVADRRQDLHAMAHIFDRVCRENGIEHRLTKINHPWTNGQVERMNRTIKEATVKRYHYETHEDLEYHLHAFVAAYNYARRLKTLSGLTPFEYIRKLRAKEPDRFIADPSHHIPGLNT